MRLPRPSARAIASRVPAGASARDAGDARHTWSRRRANRASGRRRFVATSKPRRILVALDFVGPSKRACDFALDLGAAVSASLSLVHVVERFDMRLSATEHGRVIAAAKAELEGVARKLRRHVREVETLVVEGTPWKEIDAAAHAPPTSS